MTIIEALLFVLFALVASFLYIMLLGLATLFQNQEERIKDLEGKIQTLSKRLEDKT